MIRATRRASVRLSALAVAAGLAAAGAIATAGPAAADETPSAGGTAAQLVGLDYDNGNVGRAAIDGHGSNIAAGLFNLKTEDGKILKVYCIDFGTGAKYGSAYNEVAWSESKLAPAKNPNSGKIKWILEHSYPAVPLNKLNVQGLSEAEAAAATQVAIWHFSDNVDGKPAGANAAKLTDYLEKNAEDVAEPVASLKLNPNTVAGKSGEQLGPIKVDTTADQVALTLDDAAKGNGVTIVDKDGKEISSAKNGEDIYLKAPTSKDALEATVTANAPDATVQSGRVFTGHDKSGRPSQTMILAGSTTIPQQAKAAASWAGKQTTGPIPAVSFAKDCAKGGVDVTVSNKGDENFTVPVGGKDYIVKPGESKTVLFPVKEDQPYKITVKGLNGKEWSTEGVLDCQQGTEKPTTAPSTTPSSSPSSSTGSDTSATPSSSASPNGGLADTGASSSTPMIAGIAAVLILGGAGTVFVMRKKRGAHS